mgnify:CR=1 FL=1
MSINIPGTLTVQIIQGRRGPFKTAKLATSIGTFDVKNPVLKQFEPGEYQGNFIIEQLKVKAYEWGGGATSYLDAALQMNNLIMLLLLILFLKTALNCQNLPNLSNRSSR